MDISKERKAETSDKEKVGKEYWKTVFQAMAEKNREKNGEKIVIVADKHVERMRKSREGKGEVERKDRAEKGTSGEVGITRFPLPQIANSNKEKSFYEMVDLEADPQVGEGEQGGTHRTKTLQSENKPTPPLSTPNPGVNVTGDAPSKDQISDKWIKEVIMGRLKYRKIKPEKEREKSAEREGGANRKRGPLYKTGRNGRREKQCK